MGVRFIEHEIMGLDSNSSSGSTQLRSAPLGFENTGYYYSNGGSLEYAMVHGVMKIF